MADILSATQRSALVARIRSAGNASTELRLVALLRAGVLPFGIRALGRTCGDRWCGASLGRWAVAGCQYPVGGCP